MADHLKAALWYARAGWPIIPLRWHGKTPWGGSHGVHDATCDEAIIREWFTREPLANIGCSPAGIPALVLDIDPRHGGNREGLDLPVTPTVLSGGGGWHYYFLPVTEFTSRVSAGEGLDIRRGFNPATMPPSIHANGTVYRWEVHPSTPLAPVPGWLLERIRPPERRPVRRTDAGDADKAWDRAVAYLRQVPGATEGGGEHGGRDRATYLAACKVLERFPTLGPDGVEYLVSEWDACRNNPPLGERVVRQKVASAARRIGA